MSLLLFRTVTWRSAALIVCEGAVILSCVYLAAFVRLGGGVFSDVTWSAGIFPKALLIAAITQLCMYFTDLYDFRVLAERRELFVRSVQALGATSVVLAAIYFWFPDLIVGRGVFLVAAIAIIGLLFGWRITFEWTSRRMGPRERILLVGTNEGAVELARELFERHDLGVHIVGFIDPDPARVGSAVLNPGVIGTIEDIPAIVRARAVDRVVVSLSDARGRLPMDKLLEMKLDGVTFDHLASVYEQYTGKIAVDNLRPSWLIFSDGFKRSHVQIALKRAIDVLGAIVGIVVTLPIMAVVAITIKATSRGGVLYRQSRVGLRGHVFTIYKFRSMRADAEQQTGAVWATPDDNRVTAAGRWFRRIRLDELPQLWNVLRGDMSIVGPRPERPEFVTTLTKEIPFYGQRHAVRPGLTGWAQVCYTYGASVEDAMEKLQYDLFYIKNRSLGLDLFIAAKTVKTVLMQRGGQ
ncbi:MAG TPA: TIGR03013 family XrtA/PEP-CTERM system glycosyltransferase [Vicinamibacterales bacterium]|nr:TIGR03013 family XrtA/PEP-CTERM system glycosyltransferase [Vicinamibacterales bacterium]